jgi:hypothetical protein
MDSPNKFTAPARTIFVFQLEFIVANYYYKTISHKNLIRDLDQWTIQTFLLIYITI